LWGKKETHLADTKIENLFNYLYRDKGEGNGKEVREWKISKKKSRNFVLNHSYVGLGVLSACFSS
jgi:hypothetical protein